MARFSTQGRTVAVPLAIVLLGMVGVTSDETALWAALWVDGALLGKVILQLIAGRGAMHGPNVLVG